MTTTDPIAYAASRAFAYAETLRDGGDADDIACTAILLDNALVALPEDVKTRLADHLELGRLSVFDALVDESNDHLATADLVEKAAIWLDPTA